MRNHNKVFVLALFGFVAPTGCHGDGDGGDEAAMMDTDSGYTSGSASGDGDGDGVGVGVGVGDGDGDFIFDDAPLSEYSQIDRTGMPAINSAVITSKDAYNADSPAGDAAGTYVPEIVENLTALHSALDDDLTGLGLVPCAVDDCVAQAAPLVVPDTLKLDLTMDSGFPNGRKLTDPVMDVTLAVVLLDLTVAGQDATTLVGVNPTANDVAFSDSFPYLAAAN